MIFPVTLDGAAPQWLSEPLLPVPEKDLDSIATLPPSPETDLGEQFHEDKNDGVAPEVDKETVVETEEDDDPRPVKIVHQASPDDARLSGSPKPKGGALLYASLPPEEGMSAAISSRPSQNSLYFCALSFACVLFNQYPPPLSCAGVGNGPTPVSMSDISS